MKRTALLATAVLLGTTATAANVTGKQTTPLTLQVNNFCVMAYTNPEYNGSAGLDKTYETLNLGTINAVTNNTVSDKMVMAVDCNKDTVLNIVTPESVTLTNQKGDTIMIKKDVAWSPENPFTMSFSNGASRVPDYGLGGYQYYELLASFKVGGAGTGANRAWSVPGGLYKGDLVVNFNYDE
ncbi:hypothetical protein [Deinococcus sp. Leaf326]|jgi:hypothetical protein|uniref:hypothetical protein n=1 Tax=Deinococcus sp. Leaf326 TaxID=1736338 RepID=UPI0006F6B378|nr:hypothetical protein [Deinococcus sp. Leaf326]KQR01085.1 hypothetical protein ASF71_13105 [Deinococcus sp. Leaf326]